ncbi:MAG: Ig-like domain-containing protein, partial [Longimicrobiales bacterium]|nr:Ig-like domain-containing protein [Longimicrobiales bacterium]
MARQKVYRTRFAPIPLFVIPLLLLPLLTTGCGSEGGGNTPTQPEPSKPASISLNSAAVALEAIGATQQLSATVKDQKGQTMAGTAVQWSSSNTSVATVSSSGSVTAAGVGAAMVSAVAGTVSATASITVTQVVISVAISAPANVLHDLGESLQFAAEVRDAKGHAIPSAQVTWNSSDPACVEVDPASGLATAMGFGTATISATSEPASATADLAVVYIPSSESTLLSFSFLSAENPGLSGDFDAEVDGEDVILLIPRSVDATRLVPAFTVSEGATVQVDGLQQVAGETEQDFTAVLRYTVTAEDPSQSRTYTVYVGRLLEAGEVIGWQRDAGIFRFVSDPRDIKLLEEVRIHLDSTLTRFADTLHATIPDTISIDIYPSHAAFLDKLRELGWEPKDWYIGTAIRPDWILVESSNSPDNSLTSGDVISLITHEGIHSILLSFGTPIPQWLHEGMAGLDAYLLAECFPDCEINWDFQRDVVGSTGKPGLDLMFADPGVGYAFSITTVIFIVKKYGWDALQAFLTDPTDYTVFGLADSNAFEARWHEFMDELWGWVDPGQPPLLPISEARTLPLGLVSVEGTVTWQNQWDDRIYFLQDETGGISTFHADGAIPLAEGDRIRITGLMEEFRGEVQMNPITAIRVLGHDAVPPPRTVTAAQINGGQFQGELV